MTKSETDRPAVEPSRGSPRPASPQAWLVDDLRFDAHALGGPQRPGYHPERPERLVAARAAVAAAAVDWQRVASREATAEELGRVHGAGYVAALERLRGATTSLDPDTYVAPGSVAAARLAAGSTVAMVDQLLDSDVRLGLALLRPPGHHARPDMAMGFCLLNSVAVAAAHARARGLGRVLVVDWDVHHGNGTQEMFWVSPDVLYVSLHQYPFYPGTGAADEVGDGDGRGYTVNVPLGAGVGNDVYRAAFERVVLPVAHEYSPDLVLVSAGFDASARDPLAGMKLSPAAFGWMGKALRSVADDTAKGRIGLVLEGGYDLVGLEAGLASAIAGFIGNDAADIAATTETPPDVADAVSSARRTWKAG